MVENSKQLVQELWNEIIQDDPSLVGQKDYFLELFEILIANRPEVQQDALFRTQLRDRLRYHLITQYEPAPRIKWRHQFILYGAPTVIVAAFLVAVIPFQDFKLGEKQTLSLVTTSGIIQETGVIEDDTMLGEEVRERNIQDASIDILPETIQARNDVPATETFEVESDEDINADIAPAMARAYVLEDRSDYASSYVSGTIQIDYNLIDEGDTLYFEGQLIDYGCQISEGHLQLTALYQELGNKTSGLMRFDTNDGEWYFVLLQFDGGAIVSMYAGDRDVWCEVL